MGVISGQERLDIPHEPGEWMVLRALGAKALAAAADERSAAVARYRAKLGIEWAELQDELRRVQLERLEALRQEPPAPAPSDEPGDEPEELPLAVRYPDPLPTYDQWSLCRAGIVAWSYRARLGPQAIDDLDSATLEWAARHILILSGVNAHATVEERASARKNA